MAGGSLRLWLFLDEVSSGLGAHFRVSLISCARQTPELDGSMSVVVKSLPGERRSQTGVGGVLERWRGRATLPSKRASFEVEPGPCDGIGNV